MRQILGIISNRRSGYFLLSSLFLAQTLTSWANPTGGQVVSGTASITNTLPGTLTIKQATSTAIINWQDFSIAAGELTRFQVPTSASATLNRVTGGNVSTIYGTLQSNGQLYLINPNGILVGASGKIDTAGFLGSTLDISDAQFNQQADLNLSGSSSASVTNQGTINASTGDVYLIATQVNNAGTITAAQGNVGLAAGNQVLLQKAGDQHLFVQLDSAATPKATGITNTGAIRSAAAELRAAGGNAYALAINNTGNIAATGLAKINGQVYLTADGANITNSGTISAKQANGNGGTVVLNGHSAKATTQGTVLNSGTITATGAASGAVGGTVELLGDRVGVTGSGLVDVSGAAGGGTALIGGDEHGANPAIPDANQTYLGPDATIKADALTLGNGGKVILWGNDTTQVYGAISVRGGPEGGNGGLVETSGASLQTTSIPDRSAPNGTPGTWLLDPTDITITDNAPTTSGFGAPFTLGAGPYTINQATLLSALEGGNVTLNTANGSGGTGNITWEQPNATTFDITTLVNGPTLELDAPTSILFTGITIKSVSGTGSLNLVLNSTLAGAGSVNIQNSTVDLNGGSFTAHGNGYQSLIDQNGEANGINIFNSNINAQGGNISLTGNAGYANPGTGVSAGQGVGIFTGGSPFLALQTTGGGNITITGTFAQNITSLTPIFGVLLSGDGASIEAGAGTISITGTVSAGTSGNAANAGSVEGILIENGATIEAVASGGTISLFGNATGSTSIDFDNSGGGAQGVDLQGVPGTNIISVATNGGITINGTGGNFDSSLDTSAANAGDSAGVYIGGGNEITASNGSTISIIGHGGSATTTGLYAGSARGVVIGGDSNLGASSLSVGTTGSISITGTGGTSNTTTAGAGSVSGGIGVDGVIVNSNATISAAGTSTITIGGNGGTVTSGVNQVGQASGVAIVAGFSTSFPVLVSSSAGAIDITGAAGTSPSLDVGVVVAGFNGESATVSSTSGPISIVGTGGTASTGSNTVVGLQVPSFGVLVVDDAILQTASGTIGVEGTSGAGASGVAIAELPSGSFDSTPTLPMIEGTANGSIINLVGPSGAEIDVNGIITSYDVNMISSSINLSSAAVTTTDPGIDTFFEGLTFTSLVGVSGQINITNSTITGPSLMIGEGTTNGASPGLSQVSIDGTTIHLIQGQSLPGFNTSPSLQINGTSITAGSPGVGITNGSTITADNGGQVDIMGTGLLAAGDDATGVLISDSTLSCGTVGSPGIGALDIHGYSDAGNTLLTPNSVFANNSYGVQVADSTISSYSNEGLEIHGTAYAANNLDSVGVDMSANTVVETFQDVNEIKGSVSPEIFADAPQGEANVVVGLRTTATQIEASGVTADIRIDTDTHNTTATDNGDISSRVQNIGAYFEANTSIAASGSNQTLNISPIVITGRAGPAVASVGNDSETESDGVWVSGGTDGQVATITNSGLGATVILGEAGSATGEDVVSLGVTVGNSSQPADSITAPDGGSIGIAGLGGAISAGSNTSFSGLADGVLLEYSNVTTTTGDIAILAAAGSRSGSIPAESFDDVVGLDLNSATIQTYTTLAGANQIPNGGSIPPLILIYATASTAVRSNGTVTFQLGSPTDYAVEENSTSSLVTGNLVMGNYYDLFSAYGPASVVAAAPTFAAFNTFINGTSTLATKISLEGITVNPAGIIDLSSPLNQVTNLDSVLDGSGGFNFFDSVSLTVDPIGGSNNLNYGQIDEAGIGPVSITMAPNQNLTLTDISPFTGVADALFPEVIASSSPVDPITLSFSGSGVFTNDAGASALSPGYVINANVTNPSQVNLGGLAPSPLFNPATGTIVGPLYMETQPPSPSPSPILGPGIVLAVMPVNDTLFNNDVTNPPASPPITTTKVVGGAGGVATKEDQRGLALEKGLVARFGLARATLMLEIINQDIKDGSTVNTATLTEKWVANTGLSKLVGVNGNAELFDGQANPMGNASLIFDQFRTGNLNGLSQAAFGH